MATCLRPSYEETKELFNNPFMSDRVLIVRVVKNPTNEDSSEGDDTEMLDDLDGDFSEQTEIETQLSVGPDLSQDDMAKENGNIDSKDMERGSCQLDMKPRGSSEEKESFVKPRLEKSQSDEYELQQPLMMDKLPRCWLRSSSEGEIHVNNNTLIDSISSVFHLPHKDHDMSGNMSDAEKLSGVGRPGHENISKSKCSCLNLDMTSEQSCSSKCDLHNSKSLTIVSDRNKRDKKKGSGDELNIDTNCETLSDSTLHDQVEIGSSSGNFESVALPILSKERYFVHSQLLSVKSWFFKQLFYGSGMKETNEKEV